MIDLEILSEALVGTVNSRGTSNVLQNGDEIIEDVLTSDAMSINWKRYQKKYSYASDISWEQIGDSVRKLWEIIN